MRTDSAIKSAKPAAKPVKLFDGGGLHVLIKLTGAKYRVKQTKEDAPHPLRAISDRAIQVLTKDDNAGVINGLKRRNKIETAHRLIDRLERVFRYAVGIGRMQINPAAAFRECGSARQAATAVGEKSSSNHRTSPKTS